MTTITTRAGKGSNLTSDELDANFNNLNTDKLETAGGTLTGNVTFTSAGTGIVFSDATSITSASGLGGTGLPNGGVQYDILVKNSATDGDASWTDVLTADGVQFDLTASEASAEGKLVWDDGEGTLSFLAKGGNVDVNVGQSQFILVKNATGNPLSKGQVVYINGAQGNRPTVALALADSDATSARTLGVVAESIADGAEGQVMTTGILKNVNTVGFSSGSIIYLSPTTAGAWTATKPYAPDHMVYVGFVIVGGDSNGRIDVKIQNGYELDEIHDADIGHTNTLTDNDHLVYDAASTTWRNEQLDISLDTTPTLGGTLDANSNDAVSLNAVAIGQATTSNIQASGIEVNAGSTSNTAWYCAAGLMRHFG